MRKPLFISTLAGVLAIGSAGAATIFDGASQGAWLPDAVDGWSGITVLNSANATIAAADSGGQPAFTVTSVSYSVAAGRTNNWSVIPLVINPSDEIVWAGPALVATAEGPNTFAVDSGPIPHGGLDHRIGFYQWQNGAANNAIGGTVTFGNAGGEGMFQMDVDSTLGADAAPVGLTVVGGHSSVARDYNYENEVSFGAIPEPGAVGLIGLTSLTILLRRRRK